ncbi:MAG: polymerase subunit gamma/tau, partial [Humisphaera sp.]|nr:polymerase subunit gamma/tau [Humisphaera sp.]
LKEIIKREKLKADEDALFLVAKAGAGSMRDSLSLLDRLLSVGEKELTVEMIEQLLGLPRSQLVFDLAQAIGEADVKEVLSRTDKMIAGGLATDTLIASLVDHLRNLLILRTCGPDSTLVEVPGLAMKDLSGQAMRFDPVVLSQDISILEELRRQIRTSQAGRALLDATLVRLALAEQFNSIANVLSATDGAATTQSSASSPALKKKYDEPVEATVPAVVAEDNDDDLPAVGKVWDNSGPSISEMLKQRQASAPPPEAAPAPVNSNIEPVDVHALPEIWQRMLDLLAARGAWLYSALKTGRLASIEDDAAVLRFDKSNATFAKMLSGKKELLRDIMTQAVGKPLGVRFEIEEEPATDGSAIAVMEAPPTTRPATLHRAAKPAAREIEPPAPVAPVANLVKVTPELIESLRNSEPLIKGLMDELGAQIVKIESPEAAV